MDRKREMIRELTNSVLSVLMKYEKEEQDSTLTREEAQQKAIEEIRHIRYGEEMKDYFWITDMRPNMIVHPYRSDLEGKPLNDFEDAHGKKLFVEFVSVIKQHHEGYVDYMWQWKDDSARIVPKLSFVKEFKHWGWIVGTGIYIEDVKKEIKGLTQKLLWITTIISFIIALLLLFISQQSLKIERKRITAENELHATKEKYRTLVEAATEGLIMMIDGRISFLNNVITRMTGYENNELINQSLDKIVSENNSKETIEFLSKKIIPEGQYEINLKKKNGGIFEVLITISTTVFANESVNIIILKDITTDRDVNLSVLDYQRLLNTLSIGFFRAQIDYKGRFIFANETAIRILGYDSFRELSEIYILEILANLDDRKNLRHILLKNGFVKNKVIEIHRTNKEDIFIKVTLVVLNNDNSKDFICDGIIEDITSEEKEKAETKKLIAQLYANNFLMEQDIRSYTTSLISMDMDSGIGDVVAAMARKKTDNVLLTKNNNKEFIGIITNSDIQNRVLSLKLHLDNPAYLIMSSPVSSVNDDSSVFDAIKACENKGISHLLVKKEDGEAAGMINLYDLLKALNNSLSSHIMNVGKSESIDELIGLYRNLHKQVKSLVGSDISVKNITNLTAAFSDTLIIRLINLAVMEIGQPPVDFAFICLGSEGRKEETLYTDQDNAIIYDNVSKDKEIMVNGYFIKLGEWICDALNQIGYSHCKGNVMAKNPRWCRPINDWEQYFRHWINSPEPQNLLEASIFFDYRHIYGNALFTERLTVTIRKAINDLFIYHLAYNTVIARPQQLPPGTITSDKITEIIDLKHVVNIIIMFARTYSLKNNISATNTFERLEALKSKKIITENIFDEITYAYNFLMKLRFRNQVELSDKGLQMSNMMNMKKLGEMESLLLKKSLSLIQVLQHQIEADFRVSL